MNSRKASVTSSEGQRQGSGSRRASTSSTASSTSCSLSVSSSLADPEYAGFRVPPFDRNRSYGFHRAATVKEKAIIDSKGWLEDEKKRPIPWSTTRIQLRNTGEACSAVPVYLSGREQKRCEIGDALYSSPQAGIMMSARTFKSKKRAKRGILLRQTPMPHSTPGNLPDEVRIVQSYTEGQVFTPMTYKWLAVVKYIGTFVTLTPGSNINLYQQYLPRFAESFRVKDEKTGFLQDIPASRWGSGSNQLDDLRKGDRIYTTGFRYYSEALVREMMPSEVELRNPKINRTWEEADKEIKEREG